MPRTHTRTSNPTPTHSSTTALRLKPDEHAKILDIVQQGLTLQEQLSTSDVLRIALLAFDVRKLSHSQIAGLRAKDGRALWRRRQTR